MPQANSSRIYMLPLRTTVLSRSDMINYALIKQDQRRLTFCTAMQKLHKLADAGPHPPSMTHKNCTAPQYTQSIRRETKPCMNLSIVFMEESSTEAPQDTVLTGTLSLVVQDFFHRLYSKLARFKGRPSLAAQPSVKQRKSVNLGQQP